MRGESSTKRSEDFYPSSSIKRRTRRTDAEIQRLLGSVLSILSGEEGQITIRHLFYRLVGLGVIPKVESSYSMLISHLSKWRRSGEVEWGAFADGTRWHIATETFDSVEAALTNTVATYRRNLWSTQETYVEIWCEKDSVASILAKAAEPFGVPIFVARGFASLSSLYSAANTFRERAEAGKWCQIYHFGDYDPSGVAAGESIQRAFKEDFKISVGFFRSAVTEAQVASWRLPTRPVKGSDSRAAKWTGGECVEIDSVSPARLRALVESCITQHIDKREWEVLKATEAMERATLESIRKGAGT